MRRIGTKEGISSLLHSHVYVPPHLGITIHYCLIDWLNKENWFKTHRVNDKLTKISMILLRQDKYGRFALQCIQIYDKCWMALIQHKNSIVTPYSIHNMVLFKSECKLSQLASSRAGKFSFHMVFQSQNHDIKLKAKL